MVATEVLLVIHIQTRCVPFETVFPPFSVALLVLCLAFRGGGEKGVPLGRIRFTTPSGGGGDLLMVGSLEVQKGCCWLQGLT